jgi:hypothetical protein
MYIKIKIENSRINQIIMNIHNIIIKKNIFLSLSLSVFPQIYQQQKKKKNEISSQNRIPLLFINIK